jgi:hypothetical protein
VIQYLTAADAGAIGFSAPANTGTQPLVGIYSVIPGIIGLMQASEALKIVTGAGEPLSGKLMIYNALQAQCLYFDIHKNPENFNREVSETRMNIRKAMPEKPGNNESTNS